jgi:hypothetical protein
MSEPTEDQPARDGSEITDAVMGRAGLATQLRELEAFVARSEMEGGELPAEAIEMIARLREIVQALDELTASMSDPGQQPSHEASPPNDT